MGAGCGVAGDSALSRQKLCFLVATPLTLHCFFEEHLAALTETFDVTVAYNPHYDTYLPPLNLPIHVAEVSMVRSIAPLADLSASWQIWRLCRRERFDVMVSVVPKSGLLGMVASWLAGVPCRLHIFQGEVWASKQGMMRNLLKTMDRITATFATNLLAVSASERDFLEANGVARPGRLTVLGSGSIKGVDLDRYRADPRVQAEVRRDLGIPENAVLCAFLGRIVRDKGVDELAEAFREVSATNPDLWLLIAGPDEEERTAALRVALGDAAQHVVFRGYTETPERLLIAADFLVLPSYREGFGMVVIEAAAVGIPTIGTRIHGLSDAVVDGETGVLVAPRSVEELRGAIADLANHPEKRRILGAAAQSRVRQEFDRNVVVPRYIEYIEALRRPNR